MTSEDSIQDNPAQENAADDPALAWAQALQEQQGDAVRDANAPDASQGGPLLQEEEALTQAPPHASYNAADGSGQDISRVLDIPVQLSVELGRTKVPIKYILQLAQGSVVELDALAGEPMDVLVNGYLIAQGEVVVVNDKFGIRLTDVVTPSERLRRASRS